MTQPSYPRGTKVALYLRRSKDEKQAESLDVQRSNAIAYCSARGWVIVTIYVDDAISRAEFQRRPGLFAMVFAAKAGEFAALVLRDESRLGGDVNRTGLVMQDLTDAKVGIVYYYTDELVSMDGAVNKLLVSVRSFAAEYEREKLSQRVHEHLLRKAKTGKPAGGLSFGYKIEAGEYVVHEPEAAVVRRIFDMYAAGTGTRGITHTLNAEGVPKPHSSRRGGHWGQSTVRSMLVNPRYIGQGRYNYTRALYRSGTRIVEGRPDVERVIYDTPAIIEPKVWAAVRARFARNAKFGYARARKGAAPKHLLIGLARCALCDGAISVENKHYICNHHYSRGNAVCPNALRRPVVDVDAAVAEAIRDALSTEVIAMAAASLRSTLQDRRSAVPVATDALTKEAATLKRERARFVKLIAATDDPPPTILEEIATRDARLREVDLQLAAMAASLATTEHDLDRLEREAMRRLDELQSKLAQGSAEARAVLAALLGDTKLRFTPKNGRFAFRGELSLIDRDRVTYQSRIDTVAVSKKPRKSADFVALSFAA